MAKPQTHQIHQPKTKNITLHTYLVPLLILLKMTLLPKTSLSPFPYKRVSFQFHFKSELKWPPKKSLLHKLWMGYRRFLLQPSLHLKVSISFNFCPRKFKWWSFHLSFHWLVNFLITDLEWKWFVISLHHWDWKKNLRCPSSTTGMS